MWPGNSSTYLKALLDNHRDAKRAIELAKHEGVETHRVEPAQIRPQDTGRKTFRTTLRELYRYGGHDGLAHVLQSADNLADLKARTNGCGNASPPRRRCTREWLARKETPTNEWATVEAILNGKRGSEV